MRQTGLGRPHRGRKKRTTIPVHAASSLSALTFGTPSTWRVSAM
jgi:hypothetical protein